MLAISVATKGNSFCPQTTNNGVNKFTKLSKPNTTNANEQNKCENSVNSERGTDTIRAALSKNFTKTGNINIQNVPNTASVTTAKSQLVSSKTGKVAASPNCQCDNT